MRRSSPNVRSGSSSCAFTAARVLSWHSIMRSGALPWMSPRVTPEKPGCVSEPWPSTTTQSASSAASHVMRSAAPATKSETTASTAIPLPAIAIPV